MTRSRPVSLPRRDGQGHRRDAAVALLVLVTMLSACGALAPAPVGDTDGRRSAPQTVPPRSGALRTRDAPEPFAAATFDGAVGEASGVAASLRNPGWVYVLDDGPGTRGVLALDTVDDGAVRVVVDGLDGRDTEGLAVAPCRGGRRRAARPQGGPAGGGDGRACLYIGDIGNNQELWPSVHVWRVREPRLGGRDGRLTVPGERVTLTYPAAPADAEALLVADGRPFLVTRERRDDETGRTPRPRLLAATRWGDGTLADLGTIRLPAPRVGLAAAVVGNVVTGGDVAGDDVVLRTYDHVVRYTPPAPGAPLETLGRWSAEEVGGVPVLPQSEGVALDRCGLWLVSEGVDSLWFVPDGTPDDDQEQTCPSGTGPS